MTKTLLLASTALLLTATSAFAGDAPQVAEAPVPTGPTSQAPLTDAAQRGVLVFTPDFFAAQRPNTALDMVNRVPGFSIDNGSGARGFEGAVGNVLINNNRPASKNDSGSNVLGRTLANQVERIELIRGGAAGVDMQGYAVVVNVILKSTASRQSILTWNAMLFEGGHDIYGGSYQFTARNGDRSWGVTPVRRHGVQRFQRRRTFGPHQCGGRGHPRRTVRERRLGRWKLDPRQLFRSPVRRQGGKHRPLRRQRLAKLVRAEFGHLASSQRLRGKQPFRRTGRDLDAPVAAPLAGRDPLHPRVQLLRERLQQQ